MTSLEFVPYQIPQIHPRRSSVQNLLHHPKCKQTHALTVLFNGLSFLTATIG